MNFSYSVLPLNVRKHRYAHPTHIICKRFSNKLNISALYDHSLRFLNLKHLKISSLYKNIEIEIQPLRLTDTVKLQVAPFPDGSANV